MFLKNKSEIDMWFLVTHSTLSVEAGFCFCEFFFFFFGRLKGELVNISILFGDCAGRVARTASSGGVDARGIWQGTASVAI